MSKAPKIEDFYDDKYPETWANSWDEYYNALSEWIRVTPPLPSYTPPPVIEEGGKPLLEVVEIPWGRVGLGISLGFNFYFLLSML